MYDDIAKSIYKKVVDNEDRITFSAWDYLPSWRKDVYLFSAQSAVDAIFTNDFAVALGFSEQLDTSSSPREQLMLAWINTQILTPASK